MVKKIVFWLILISFFVGCKKQQKIDSNEDFKTVSVHPALVGKWKLVSWKSDIFNKQYCEYVGFAIFEADTNGVNVEIVVEANGTVKHYENDSLKRVLFLTPEANNENNEIKISFGINSSNLSITFFKNTVGLDTIGINESAYIKNPCFDVNFSNQYVKYVLVNQTYLKIE